MRGMPLNPQGEEGNFWSRVHNINSSISSGGEKRKKPLEAIWAEPRSVLDSRSSSPPTPSSTLSSSPLGGCGGGGNGGAGSSSAAAADWALKPVSAADEKCSMGVEDWEAILSDSSAPSPIQEQTFLQWIMTDDSDEPSPTAGLSKGPIGFDGHSSTGFGIVDFDPIAAMAGDAAAPSSATFGKGPTFGDPSSNTLLYPQDPIEEKPLFVGPGLVLNQKFHQAPPNPNPSFFLSPPPSFSVNHHHHHHQQLPPFPYHLQQRPTKPRSAENEAQQQQQALIDQLFGAAEMVEAGNTISARGILARLNHHLPSPIGKKPLLRSAFYFKDALFRLLLADDSTDPIPPLSPPSTLLEVVMKLGTYKAFSEVSPVLQFTNFTSIQTILEELGGSDRIHIVDFDIGIGGQWSSFMQELAHRRSSSGTVPSLKITAFASHCSHHPLELHLTRENLAHFASDLGIPFEFNVLTLDPSDLSLLLSVCTGFDEAIAVNLPIGSSYQLPLPTILSFLKQISPKIVVSVVDNGFDRSEFPFSHHFLHALQSSTVFLDSIDSTGTNPDVANKIERFILQPRIESSLMGRHRAANKMIIWRSLFTSAGLIPVQFSNFTETQAECLLKRVQVRGFHVEKHQASLSLCWQRGELVSVSAWRF